MNHQRQSASSVMTRVACLEHLQGLKRLSWSRFRKGFGWGQRMAFILIALVWIGSFWFGIMVNTSRSLPHYCYLVQKGSLPAKGEFALFYHPLFREPLIKRVEGAAGDRIEIRDNNVYVAGRPIGPLVDRNSEGEELVPVRAKVVPQKYYFVAGDHRKSFDSCYEAFGLVHQSQMEGRAWPIF